MNIYLFQIIAQLPQNDCVVTSGFVLSVPVNLTALMSQAAFAVLMVAEDVVLLPAASKPD